MFMRLGWCRDFSHQHRVIIGYKTGCNWSVKLISKIIKIWILECMEKKSIF